MAINSLPGAYGTYPLDPELDLYRELYKLQKEDEQRKITVLDKALVLTFALSLISLVLAGIGAALASYGVIAPGSVVAYLVLAPLLVCGTAFTLATLAVLVRQCFYNVRSALA